VNDQINRSREILPAASKKIHLFGFASDVQEMPMIGMKNLRIMD
jgi:hypothetical protein